MILGKRWYQLSIRQLLAAMAVVALLCWLNRPVPEYVFVNYGIDGMVPIGYSQGWPLTFRPYKWREIQVILTPSADSLAPVAQPPKVVAPTIFLVPLLGNIFVGAVLVILALIVVGQLDKWPRFKEQRHIKPL